MPRFSAISKERLQTCDTRLITVANLVVPHFDCTVLCGHRDEGAQNIAFNDGRSKKRWPDSPHNVLPSRAIDIAPWPIDWNDLARFRYFAGWMMAMAVAKDIRLRWGGDWDRDTDLKDQTFNDLVHFELVE